MAQEMPGRDGVGLGAAVAEAAGGGGDIAGAAGEGDAREQVGDGDADARRGAGELAFGDADIRAAAQQSRRIAHRHDAGQRRQISRRGEFGAQCAGFAPDQHRQPMNRARHRRLERRDGAERAGQLRLRARGVELGAAAGIEPRLGEIQRRLLVHHVALRDVELLLEAAQLEVGARHLGRHDDLRIALGRLDGAELRVAGLDAAADAAEEVEFPERVEARVVELAVRAACRRWPGPAANLVLV